MKSLFFTLGIVLAMLIMPSVGWSQVLRLSDPAATSQASHLFSKLDQSSRKGFLFGHQDDLAYGVDWKYVSGKSDVQELTGDYPGIYGWDISGLEKPNPQLNIDGVPFSKMTEYIKQAYREGALVTISWHMNSPLADSLNAWDTTHGTVNSILPGGANHERYRHWLDFAADYFQHLRGDKGELIPILFRPFHEFTGTWFWWCKNTCSKESFVQLWRFTVDYLRNQKGLHQLIWVYNTSGNFSNADEFLERYPGDDVVDMLSFDNYQYNNPEKDSSFLHQTRNGLLTIHQIASKKGKLLALGETGYEAIPYAQWWTKVLLPIVQDIPVAYVLLWRNHGYHEGMKHMHYYVPHNKEQASAQDFIRFYQLPQTFFSSDAKRFQYYR